MEIKDMLSESDIKAVYDEIYASPDYRKLTEKYQKFRKSGDFAQMYVMAKKMKDYEIGVFEGIARRFVSKLKMTRDWVEAMPGEDRKNLSVLSYSVYMLADVLEMFIMELNELLKKNTSCTVSGFDKLNEVAKEAKKIVLHFDSIMSDEKSCNLFSACSDDLYKLIFNKASSYKNKLEKYAEKTDKKAPRNAEVA